MVVGRIRSRFHIGGFCIVADRGMISEETLKELKGRNITYIPGTMMRKVKKIKGDVLSSQGRYRDVYPEGKFSKDPAHLKVKEVTLNGSRYILCLNLREVRKDAQDCKTIIESLKEKIKTNPKVLIGNKGYNTLRLTRAV